MAAITLPVLVQKGIPAKIIGVDSYKLGLVLLEDDYGNKTDAIAAAHRHDPEMIAIKVFQKWINGDGKTPVTWTTLIQVLKDLKMNRLAETLQRH